MFSTTGPTTISIESGSTTNYYISSENYFNAVQSGVTNVFLPPNPLPGQQHVIKDIDGNAAASNITVWGSGYTIDGSATETIATNYGSITLVLGPTEWNII